jgi:hypothetical protein
VPEEVPEFYKLITVNEIGVWKKKLLLLGVKITVSEGRQTTWPLKNQLHSPESERQSKINK